MRDFLLLVLHVAYVYAAIPAPISPSHYRLEPNHENSKHEIPSDISSLISSIISLLPDDLEGLLRRGGFTVYIEKNVEIPSHSAAGGFFDRNHGNGNPSKDLSSTPQKSKPGELLVHTSPPTHSDSERDQLPHHVPEPLIKALVQRTNENKHEQDGARQPSQPAGMTLKQSSSEEDVHSDSHSHESGHIPSIEVHGESHIVHVKVRKHGSLVKPTIAPTTTIPTKRTTNRPTVTPFIVIMEDDPMDLPFPEASDDAAVLHQALSKLREIMTSSVMPVIPSSKHFSVKKSELGDLPSVKISYGGINAMGIPFDVIGGKLVKRDAVAPKNKL